MHVLSSFSELEKGEIWTTVVRAHTVYIVGSTRKDIASTIILHADCFLEARAGACIILTHVYDVLASDFGY